MSSFYGNMKNNSRASFIFDRIYPTRTAMEAALNAVDNDNKPIGDGIFINRYVLVDYHYALTDPIVTQDNIDKYYIEVDNDIITTQNFHVYYIRLEENNIISYIHPTIFEKGTGIKYYQKKVFLDRYETNNGPYVDRFESNNSISNSDIVDSTNELQENELYYMHRYTDWNSYKATYDSTVWMKIYADGKERYIMVAQLDAKAPILEFVDDSPSCTNGSGHFDARASTDLNYVYFIPRNWNIILNQYNPQDVVERTEDNNYYYYYQDEYDSNPSWYEDYIYTSDELAQAGKTYYIINFQIDDTITVGSSIKNLHCYIPKYEAVTNEQLNSLIGDSINGDYYVYVDGKYNLTTDTHFQAKQYYTLVENQYVAADESVALEGVQYYRITSITPVENVFVNKTNVTGYYEKNNQKKTFNDNVEYPYFNAEGFNPKVSTHVSTKGQGVFLKEVQSVETYPKHVFAHAGLLTADTYLPNRYFTYQGPKTPVETGHIYNKNHAYYIGPIEVDETSTYRLISLIYKDDGSYGPATDLTSASEQYYYDEDLTNINYFKKSTGWHPGTAYYEITTAVDEYGVKQSAHDEDTYRLDVYLPELGNTVADIYDILYGAPIIQSDKNDGYNNLIGYCSTDQFKSYNLVGWCNDNQKQSYVIDNNNGQYGFANNERFNFTDDNPISALSSEKSLGLIKYCTLEQLNSYTELTDNYEYMSSRDDLDYKKGFNLTEAQLDALADYNEELGYIYPIYKVSEHYVYPVYEMPADGDYWASNKIFNLTDEQFNELSPEIYPGVYDIPVYLKEGSNVRPYNNERLKSTIATPYDNLIGENDISLGWSLTLLKRYISELRQLAYGKDENGHQIGLQVDWTQENDELIGYIQHRPVLITNYVKTSDTVAAAGKNYYQEYVENGEVKYKTLSEHYELLTGPDYEALGYYYEDRQDVMHKIDNTNYTQVSIPNDLCLIEPISNSSINASNYINYWLKNSETEYIKPTSYSELATYYNARYTLTGNDFSQWFYEREVETYVLITEENPLPESYTGDIYNDTLGLSDSISTAYDYISDEDNDIFYLYDFNGNGTLSLNEQITDDNVEQVSNIRDIYEYTSNGNIPLRFIGKYYKTIQVVYDSIDNSNYINNKPMYKNNNNEYTLVTNSDYSNYNYFYQTENITYDLIQINPSVNNYARERQKYKLSGSQYVPVTMQDFIATVSINGDNEAKYYIVNSSSTGIEYQPINNSTWQEIESREPKVYDIYQRYPGVVAVGDSLTTLGFVPYELPRTNSNNIDKDKSMYIRCSEYSTYDPDTQYYIWDGSRYSEAVYTETDYYVEPIEASTQANGFVQYNYGYQVTVEKDNNDENIITQRVYSNCNARTLFDSDRQINHNIALYHNYIDENDTYKRKSVRTFSIIMTNDNDSTTNAPEISDTLLNLRDYTQSEVVDYLNNYLLNNYSGCCSITVDTSYPSATWPVEDIEEENISFYYVSLGMNYRNFPLDGPHFNANKTKYFTAEKIPIEQEDYEIHNIWNTVLERVLAEP